MVEALATRTRGEPGVSAPASGADAPVRLATENLSAFYGTKAGIREVSLSFTANAVHALIGPSGCGKSTFLRTLNRMHELTDGGRISGRVLLDGKDIYGAGVSAMTLRRRIGMVFQRPTPFPTMSIFENVA
ncbi:MAG: ATP-binding cassette domain-containing protein, partial [Gemmatimonadota bacterium]